MNIFVLDNDPIISAKMLCNKHVVKMITEGNQMLCNCFDQKLVPYKRTHYNHPCSVWVRESTANYHWLYFHTKELCREYTKRYNKIHKGQLVLENLPYYRNKNKELTPFVQAMPEQYRQPDTIQAYQQYYLNEKLHFCKWMSIDDISAFILKFITNNKIEIEQFLR